MTDPGDPLWARAEAEARALLSMALKCPNEWNAVGAALARRNKV